jgi:hypothetical protein
VARGDGIETVDEPLLTDRNQEPSDTHVERLLGQAKRHWGKLIQQATSTDAALRWSGTRCSVKLTIPPLQSWPDGRPNKNPCKSKFRSIK